MARKGKKKKDDKDSPAVPPASMNTEGMMADLGKLLEEHDFESIDEVNAFLQKLLKSGQPIPRQRSRTPLEQAQDLVYQAWETPSGKKRVALARKALQLSPDCADAYLILAQETGETLEQVRELLEQAVVAGERALGEKAFEEDVGYFWGILETRPYMRARENLAHVLWQLGEKQAAVEHYQDMLRLNPNDNQGIRYSLLHCLLDLGDTAAIQELLADYEQDASAHWLYGSALYLFQTESDSEAATKRLQEALDRNKYVPAYLLGRKRLPKQLPAYMTWGGEDEAQAYAVDARAVWITTSRALKWLNTVWKAHRA